MQSFQNQVVLLLTPNAIISSWSKVLLNLHNKLKVTVTDVSGNSSNSLCYQIQPQFSAVEGSGRELQLSTGRNSGFSSYSSLGSFEQDKKVLVGRKSFLRPDNATIQISARSFKTQRNKDAEAGRNPSIAGRLKKALQVLFLKDGGSTTQGKQASTPSSEKLQEALKGLPPEEADKLKIAFAEGYTAANTGKSPQDKEGWGKYYRYTKQVLSLALLAAILYYVLSASLGGNGMFRINVISGHEVLPEEINVTFNDVKGVDEAKTELQEVVEFLRNPQKFISLGGKLPKGVLLVGPPGTGKTLLARAVAGEAGVPFYHAAGSEFDEILVGQGARRIRDLFKNAKLKAPCVIFIDEIDSVGSTRTSSVLHPYANQTINQLLSEMDGFRQNEGVIVLGATNRRDDLDKALLRPGRFDVEVQVPAPDQKGRKEIILHYLSKVKRSKDLNVEGIVRGTTGFTGADLENMVNQAALRAAIEGADAVENKHLEFARDKALMGVERKSRIMDDESKWLTAYHEGGHALVAIYTKEATPLHKVTIIPRGDSLGHTSFLPDKEKFNVTRSQLLAQMDVAMGGRAAEEILYGADKVTTGAANDLDGATQIATEMVKTLGMSDKIGLRTIKDNSRAFSRGSELGPGTTETVDNEIKRLLQESYERARKILNQHAKEHRALAEALFKYETLDAEDVKALLKDGVPTQRLINRSTPAGGGDSESSNGKVNSNHSSSNGCGCHKGNISISPAGGIAEPQNPVNCPT